MASTAATPNTSGAPSAKVDELRGVLASKGLVVKDSILARLAKSKSFKETLTLAQDAERQQELSAQSTDNEAHTQSEDLLSEASITQKSQPVEASNLKQEVSGNTADISNFSGSSDTNKGNTLPASNGGRILPLDDPSLHSNSEEEKKQRRTERFGAVPDDEKLKQRAARFGIIQDLNEEAEKKRARAARFGIVDEEAKKKARLERFGKDSEQEDKEEIEKRKARALRFAPPTEKNPSEAKLDSSLT